jgi:hypothetical protein
MLPSITEGAPLEVALNTLDAVLGCNVRCAAVCYGNADAGGTTAVGAAADASGGADVDDAVLMDAGAAVEGAGVLRDAIADTAVGGGGTDADGVTSVGTADGGGDADAVAPTIAAPLSRSALTVAASQFPPRWRCCGAAGLAEAASAAVAVATAGAIASIVATIAACAIEGVAVDAGVTATVKSTRAAVCAAALHVLQSSKPKPRLCYLVLQSCRLLRVLALAHRRDGLALARCVASCLLAAQECVFSLSEPTPWGYQPEALQIGADVDGLLLTLLTTPNRG